MTHAEVYLREVMEIVRRIDPRQLESFAAKLAAVRDAGGRLFFAGVGGSAANASHAACDFRKIGGFEAYCITDNVVELTARTNDEGWDSTFVEYLRGCRLQSCDALFVFSVGGGDLERNVSANLVRAMDYAIEVGAAVFGIVGRDGGHTARFAQSCIIVPSVNDGAVTPHTESFQAVLWHLLVTHPRIQSGAMKWEGLAVEAIS